MTRTCEDRVHWLSGLTDFETNALTTRPSPQLYDEVLLKAQIKLSNPFKCPRNSCGLEKTTKFVLKALTGTTANPYWQAE